MLQWGLNSATVIWNSISTVIWIQPTYTPPWGYISFVLVCFLFFHPTTLSCYSYKKIDVKKGRLAEQVGLEEEEDGGSRKLMKPVSRLHHPLLADLLGKAQDLWSPFGRPTEASLFRGGLPPHPVAHRTPVVGGLPRRMPMYMLLDKGVHSTRVAVIRIVRLLYEPINIGQRYLKEIILSPSLRFMMDSSVFRF